jgi:hypothetical protein
MNVWRVIFYRGDEVYNTTYLPWSTLIYYCLMNMMGHAYVNSSNMNLKRKSLIRTQSTNYRDFCLVPVFAPIFWLISTIIVMRAPEDLSSTEGSTKYTHANVFFWNLFLWQLPYFIGLQFTHTDQPPFTKFVLSPEAMKEWPKVLWIAFIMLVVVGLAIMAYMIAMYVKAGVFVGYLIFGLLIVAFFVVKTYLLRNTHKIHVHHYTVGMVIIALIGYQSVIAGLIQGFCNGMMIEGGGRWGYDDIWIKKQPEEAPPAPAQDIEKGAVEIVADSETEANRIS